jgi:hypothetical protein
MSENMSIKVTSLASSSSGMPTPPHPTPRTEAADHVESVAGLDLAAVGPILEPIQELLNEAAEESKYPSPPSNTPAFTSPAPSVRGLKHSYGRGRGLSAINDRLAKLKLIKRPSASSNVSDTQSMAPSISEEGDGEREEFTVNDGKDLNYNLINSVFDKALTNHSSSGDIKVGLGSSMTNPHIEEYLAFQPSELPITGSAVDPNTVEQDRPASASKSFISHKSQKSEAFSFKSEGGVSEKSNWPELVVDSFERALLQLEQLIKDELDEDPTIDPKEYYIMRLKEVLSDKKRTYRMDIKKKDGLLIITEEEPVNFSEELHEASKEVE